MRWVGHVARFWANVNAYRALVGNPEEKRPLRRSRIILKWILKK
jgi:hypothetical protein